MLQGGQIFAGRYRVERRIAQGGMGVIYAAEHLATEEQVALKVLWPHVLDSKTAVEKFQLEARVAARVGGEHIVRIVDAGFDDKLGVPYLAMELLRGRTLEALVQEQGPLSPAELLVAFRQVAKALDKAHGYVDREGRPAPIVHRDLKPENVFVALRDEGPAVVKVLDFGIAKVLTQSQKLSQEVRGTPRYMAFEQFTGGVISPRLDVWALGLIAYYLLTGRPYWCSGAGNENGLAQLLTEVITLPIEPPSQRAAQSGVVPSWPAGFDAWFLQCVNRDPEARFASAGLAAEALAAALAGSATGPAELAEARASLTRKAGPGGEKAPASGPLAASGPASAPVSSVGSTELVGAPPSWPSSARGLGPSSGPTVPAEPLAAALPNSTTGSVASSLLAPPPARRQTSLGLWGVVGAGALSLVAMLGFVLTKGGLAPGAGAPPAVQAASAGVPAAVVPATAPEPRPLDLPLAAASAPSPAAPPGPEPGASAASPPSSAPPPAPGAASAAPRPSPASPPVPGAAPAVGHDGKVAGGAGPKKVDGAKTGARDETKRPAPKASAAAASNYYDER